MSAYGPTRCADCGHEERRYSNVKHCRNCGGPLVRPRAEDADQVKLALARRIVARAWEHAEHDRDLRELLRKWDVL